MATIPDCDVKRSNMKRRLSSGKHVRALAWAVFSVASVALAGCSDKNSTVATETSVSLQILWTNDTHGYFFPVYHAEYEEIDTYAGTAATEGKVGGYAQIKGLVDSLKAQKTDGNTLFLDGGDTFDGSPTAQMTNGAAVVPVLNAMGYDAMVPGNRDFAFGKTDFLADTAALTFPVVCANLLDATTDQYVFPRYIIKQLPGLKVAIIGVTSPLASSTTGLKVLGISGNGAFAIEDQISALAGRIRNEQNPDLVIMLSHLGYIQDQKFASRSTGIDVIVGAHTHHNVYDAPKIKNMDGSRDVVVGQAGSHGKFLGKLDLQVGLSSKKVLSYKNQLIRMNNQVTTTPDATVQALAAAAYAPYAAYFDQVIGTTTTVIERRGDTQSTMANLLTDAYAAIHGADTARHFGIRYGSSIPGSVANPANITVGDVWNMVSPNIGGNQVYLVPQTGAQLKSSIDSGLNQEYGADIYNWGGGDVTRYSGSLHYTYRVNAPDNQHIVDMSITSGGTTYPLVTNGVNNATNQALLFNVIATSGTTAQVIPGGTATQAVDEIIAYITAQGTVAPVIDNRTAAVP